jgi:hypothetical protein
MKCVKFNVLWDAAPIQFGRKMPFRRNLLPLPSGKKENYMDTRKDGLGQGL